MIQLLFTFLIQLIMKCEHPLIVRDKLTGSGIEVPCGRCYWCLRKRRTDWIIRMREEFKVCDTALFITLTYDDLHLPIGSKVNKRDVQLFLKRYRKEVSDIVSVRYFLCSEYGPTTLRPHYHAIFFYKFHDGLSVSPLLLDRLSSSISDKWQNGFVYVGTCTDKSITYCSKYMIKPIDSSDEYKTFILVSRRRGLGYNYVTNEKNLQFHFEDILGNRVYRFPNGFRSSLPRYYCSLIFLPVDSSYRRYYYDSIGYRRASSFKEMYRKFVSRPYNKSVTFGDFIRLYYDGLSINGQIERNRVLKNCKL